MTGMVRSQYTVKEGFTVCTAINQDRWHILVTSEVTVFYHKYPAHTKAQLETVPPYSQYQSPVGDSTALFTI
jgi:esterase/lipase